MRVFCRIDGDVLKDPAADDVGLVSREAVAGTWDDLGLQRGHERAGAHAVTQELWVGEVVELTAVYIGPKQLLVLADVVPVDGVDLTASVGRLRRTR